MEARGGDHAKGIRYLTAAKKLTVIARQVDEDEAAYLRRTADRLTERGIDLIVKSAREMAALVKQGAPPTGGAS